MLLASQIVGTSIEQYVKKELMIYFDLDNHPTNT